jgi:threonine/homoserine/homoserine lactone efflux protein
VLPVETLAVFFAAAVALALAPGPDNLFVLTQGALHGRMAGALVTLGLCTGLIVHTAAVALGVAALLKASPLAFAALQFLGAAYLLYLAWGAWRAGAMPIDAARAPALDARSLYVRGIVMNVTNPKVAIFFLAFLPQFTDPSRGSPAWQVVVLGIVFGAATLLVFGSIAWAAGAVGDRLRASPGAQVVLNRVAAIIFVGLALRLALASAP